MNRHLASELASHFEEGAPSPVIAAYLFGSHVEGRAHRESDIDVGVLLAPGARTAAADRYDAADRLSAWLQGRLGTDRVDLVILDEAPPGLAAQIVTRGKLVFCRDTAAEHAFRRDVQLRAADLVPFLRRNRAVKLDRLKS